MTQVEVMIAVATDHKGFAGQIANLIGAGFQPYGSPYVPPFWTPTKDAPSPQPGQMQIAQVYVRVHEPLVTSFAALNGGMPRPGGHG